MSATELTGVLNTVADNDCYRVKNDSEAFERADKRWLELNAANLASLSAVAFAELKILGVLLDMGEMSFEQAMKVVLRANGDAHLGSRHDRYVTYRATVTEAWLAVGKLLNP